MGKQAVTVIGLGPMGQAMANAFLDKGHPVTVWNRTASKADELVAKGAVRAGTVDEALAANELVVLSLIDYDAMHTILASASATALQRRVLVNLGSDTPQKVRDAATWVTERGAQFLAGAVLVPPSGVGSSESSAFYSGSREVFETYQETLTVLTGTDYRGADPGLAAVYYQIGMEIFWSTMVGYVHAMAVADANGISAQDYLPYATMAMSLIPSMFAFYAPRIDAGHYPGDVESLAMSVATVEHMVRTTQDAGIDATLPTAFLDVLRRGIADGYANESFTSVIKLFKNDAA